MKKLLFLLCAITLITSAQTLFAQDTEAGKTINAGVLNGKAISLPVPEYPEKAKENNIRGSVVVEIVIDKVGTVESAKAKSGHPELREASTAAALKSKFEPMLLEGKPVKVRGVLVYNFGDKPARSKTAISGKPTLGVINGAATSLPEAEYPAAAKAVCAEGTVNVKVEIDANGDVLDAEDV